MGDIHAMKQLLIVIKDTSGKATVAVLQQALRHKSIFAFAELLNVPCVQDLQNNSNERPWYELLRIFTYGNYSDYIALSHQLPPLQDYLVLKLRKLSVLSLASRSRRLEYDVMLQHLGLANNPELEALLISCLDSNILKGKINQRERFFQVTWAYPRDVIIPTGIDDMIAKIDIWLENVEKLGQKLEAECNRSIQRKSEEDKNQQIVSSSILSVRNKIKS